MEDFPGAPPSFLLGFLSLGAFRTDGEFSFCHRETHNTTVGVLETSERSSKGQTGQRCPQRGGRGQRKRGERKGGVKRESVCVCGGGLLLVSRLRWMWVWFISPLHLVGYMVAAVCRRLIRKPIC